MPHWKLNQTYHFRGKRVAFDTFGQGEPLVLVHGTPSSSYIWRHQIRSLRRHFTVYVYDFLGYGQSEKREGQKVSLGEQTELLDELLTHWGLERPLIAGHDFGGAVTLRVHLLKKRRFKKMALLDPVALSPWGTSFVQLVRQFPQAFAACRKRFIKECWMRISKALYIGRFPQRIGNPICCRGSAITVRRLSLTRFHNLMKRIRMKFARISTGSTFPF